MSTTAVKPATTPIPVQLSDTEFTAFILPHLSMPKRGPKCKLGYHRVFNLILWVLYTGMQWKCLPIPQTPMGSRPSTTRPSTKSLPNGPMMGRSGRRSWPVCGISRTRNTRYQRAPWRRDQHRGQKRGDGIGYSGYKHQKGRRSSPSPTTMAMCLLLLPVAPVNETDMVLLPKGLKALKQVAKEVGLDLRGAYLNLDGGFDSRANRKCIFNAGMIPNITENPRNRKHTKRGRKRFFNAAIHALRMRVERTFAWEDKFKRLLLRFERIQQRHYGMKLLAYTLINLREFCGT